MVAGIVLAAGAAARFGAPKPLAPFRGRPLVEWPLAALLAAGLDPVVVVLGAHAAAIRAGADLRGAHVVEHAGWGDGLSSSLAAGLAAARDARADAALVVLGDQPLIAPEAVRRVLAARAPGIAAVRATYAGRAGHPVLLERETWDAVRALHGDRGAADALRERRVALVACDGAGSDADADTPRRLAALARAGDPSA
jgi:CTP:molybdopterin cytidylyltransferase MocA